jgi:hypothetical protein
MPLKGFIRQEIVLPYWTALDSFLINTLLPFKRSLHRIGFAHLGSMLWSQFSAIFDNCRWKNWRFFSKTNVMINFLNNFALFWAKNANVFVENILKNHNIGPRYCVDLDKFTSEWNFVGSGPTFLMLGFHVESLDGVSSGFKILDLLSSLERIQWSKITNLSLWVMNLCKSVLLLKGSH